MIGQAGSPPAESVKMTNFRVCQKRASRPGHPREWFPLRETYLPRSADLAGEAESRRSSAGHHRSMIEDDDLDYPIQKFQSEMVAQPIHHQPRAAFARSFLGNCCEPMCR